MLKAAAGVNLGQKREIYSQQLKMAVVGAGILGTATALGFAKIAKLNISVYDISKKQEEKSSAILQREFGREDFCTRISFYPDLSEAIQDSDYVAVCVPTPSSHKPNEPYDYSMIDKVMEELNEKISGKTTILVRSTIDPLWLRKKSKQFEDKIWYMPAFFKEETYLTDSINSQYIILGLPNFKLDTVRKAEALLSGFNCSKHLTTLETAALTKLFVNAFLATKISFFNEIGNVAFRCGESPQELADLVALDPRIGTYGSVVGRPYDGKCLPKDVEAILKLFDYLKVISAAKRENDEMKDIR
jgi:UDPglucose 6-dehydrogenase